jgi:biotin operon repressor BirA-like protein
VKTHDRILAWLRDAGGPLSGEELARRLGCTRAAVWKHVAGLRRQGYTIAARRAAGYALAGAPDRLGPAELAPHLTGRWRRIEWRAEVDSTQRLARDLARAGAPEGTAVVAERQTAGHGRLGRQWHSPAGVNLYCSVILRPRLAPAAVPRLALVAGVAVAVAVEETAGRRPAIKWPNDVLLDGRKVAGVLTEMDAEVERVAHVIAGIGVNLNAPARAFRRISGRRRPRSGSRPAGPSTGRRSPGGCSPRSKHVMTASSARDSRACARSGNRTRASPARRCAWPPRRASNAGARSASTPTGRSGSAPPPAPRSASWQAR